MIGMKSKNVEGQRNAVAASVYHALRPTIEATLLNVRYRLRSEARPGHVSERDYALLQVLARGKRCIFDVGANVGLTTLVMCETMAADGRLIAFEASENGCYLIRDNVALNGLSGRVQVVNALVAERSGCTLDFFGDAASGSSSVIPGYLAHHRSLSKATLALDDFVVQTALSPELIKIDVEGAELAVLAGLAMTMRTLRPLVFVELHSWGDVTVPDTVAKLLPQLAELGYSMLYLRTNTIVTDPTELVGRGRCHVLLCPDDRPLPEDLATFDTTGF